jgi:predicted enzyme related to lactoylglutathione lyase
MHRPVHFEIQASDPDKLASFYGAIFGWNFQKWEGPMEYWLISTGPTEKRGIDGGMLRRQGPVGTVVTIEVADLDATLKQVDELGGKCVVPKMEVPGVGWLAYVKDPEETIWGVLQPPTSGRQ